MADLYAVIMLLREHIVNKMILPSDYVLKPDESIRLYMCSTGEIISITSMNDDVFDCQDGSVEHEISGMLSIFVVFFTFFHTLMQCEVFLFLNPFLYLLVYSDTEEGYFQTSPGIGMKYKF